MTNSPNVSDGAAATEQRTRRKKSTSFPVVGLSEAASVLKEAGKYGFQHSVSAFARFMGHESTNSGAFRQKLAAFRDWNLVSGRGDTLTLTETAKAIAHPPDALAERAALRTAFMNSEVFANLYDSLTKDHPIELDRVGSLAVLNFKVSPQSRQKFVDSFVDSVLASRLGERVGESEVVLYSDMEAEADEVESQPSSADPIRRTSRSGQPAETSSLDRSAPLVVGQTWRIETGLIRFEIFSRRPIAADAFAAVGRVVKELESLAETLGMPDEIGRED